VKTVAVLVNEGYLTTGSIYYHPTNPSLEPSRLWKWVDDSCIKGVNPGESDWRCGGVQSWNDFIGWIQTLRRRLWFTVGDEFALIRLFEKRNRLIQNRGWDRSRLATERRTPGKSQRSPEFSDAGHLC
jgi:hypothetical protein